MSSEAGWEQMRNFEDELRLRGLIPSALPKKKDWKSDGKNADKSYLTTCVYPPRCAGMGMYHMKRLRWFPLPQYRLVLSVA
jgi:hypothetical protein